MVKSLVARNFRDLMPVNQTLAESFLKKGLARIGFHDERNPNIRGQRRRIVQVNWVSANS